MAKNVEFTVGTAFSGDSGDLWGGDGREAGFQPKGAVPAGTDAVVGGGDGCRGGLCFEQ